MKKHFAKKTVLTILVGLLPTMISCGESLKNTASTEKAAISNYQKGVVTLEKVGSLKFTTVMRLTNNLGKSIYLAYVPSNEHMDKLNGYVFHSLRCAEKGKNQSSDYSSNTHGLMTLDPLENGQSVDFEVEVMPADNRNCNVSVLYYDNEEVPNLMNNKPMDLSTAEDAFIEKSKRFVEMTIEAGTK